MASQPGSNSMASQSASHLASNTGNQHQSALVIVTLLFFMWFADFTERCLDPTFEGGLYP